MEDDVERSAATGDRDPLHHLRCKVGKPKGNVIGACGEPGQLVVTGAVARDLQHDGRGTARLDRHPGQSRPRFVADSPRDETSILGEETVRKAREREDQGAAFDPLEQTLRTARGFHENSTAASGLWIALKLLVWWPFAPNKPFVERDFRHAADRERGALV
jgi:hypothetical protein